MSRLFHNKRLYYHTENTLQKIISELQFATILKPPRHTAEWGGAKKRFIIR